MSSRNVIELVVLAALWGASFLFMRMGAPEFGPVALIGLRTAIAAVFLLPIVIAAKRLPELWPNLGRLWLVGAIGTALPFTLLSWATLSVSAGYTSILNATAPIFTAIIAWLWVGDRLDRNGILGLVIGFVGVGLLVLDRQGGQHIALLPVLAGLTATFCYGFGANYTRQRLQHIPPLVNALGSQAGAAVTLLPLTLWLWPQQTPGQDAWLGVIILGVACTAIAFILYFRLIAQVGPNKAITVTYLIPLFGVLWGMLFLGETLSSYMVVGGAFILFGVSLTSGVFKRKR